MTSLDLVHLVAWQLMCHRPETLQIFAVLGAPHVSSGAITRVNCRQIPDTRNAGVHIDVVCKHTVALLCTTFASRCLGLLMQNQLM